jgi:hypothetical protein
VGGRGQVAGSDELKQLITAATEKGTAKMLRCVLDEERLLAYICRVTKVAKVRIYRQKLAEFH